MRTRTIVPIAIITAVVGTLAFAAPASAATVAETPITVAVAAGSLDITAPGAGPTLEPLVADLDAQNVAFELGAVEVIDGRALVDAAWTVSVTVADFTIPGTLEVDLAAPNSAYTSTVVATTPDYVVTPTVLANLSATAVVQSGAGTGINQSSWIPTITVVIPANATAGAYSSSVTHSVV